MTAGPTFFTTEADFRDWLAAHHATAPALLVGFWKKASGRPSIDWPRARDQALCFGWIDGVRKSLGADSYTIRFTPRRKGSIWSKVNVARFHALAAEGRMTPAGAAAFGPGREDRSHYSYESEARAFAPAEEALFRSNAAAWADWEKRPPGYRKMVAHWVTSAKRAGTRARRLAALIADSEAGRKIRGLDIGRNKQEGGPL